MPPSVQARSNNCESVWSDISLRGGVDDTIIAKHNKKLIDEGLFADHSFPSVFPSSSISSNCRRNSSSNNLNDNGKQRIASNDVTFDGGDNDDNMAIVTVSKDDTIQLLQGNGRQTDR